MELWRIVKGARGRGVGDHGSIRSGTATPAVEKRSCGAWYAGSQGRRAMQPPGADAAQQLISIRSLARSCGWQGGSVSTEMQGALDQPSFYLLGAMTVAVMVHLVQPGARSML